MKCALAFLLLALTACGNANQINEVRAMPSTIEAVKAKHTKELMALPGVVSVGIGRDAAGKPAIMVGLKGPHPETRARIPHSLDGYPVVVQEIGAIRAE